MIALLVITDGRRDCITQTVSSAAAMLDGPITERWMYNDCPDPAHQEWLAEQFPNFELFRHRDGRQGFGGAIREAWAMLGRNSKAEFVFHLEDDFTFNRPVPLDDLRTVLVARPMLAQVALRRQPWNAAEKAAGGVVETNPAAYVEHNNRDGIGWLEHDLFFTTNPSLYRRDLIEQFEWPEGANSEGVFSARLREADRRFAYFGRRNDGERVLHIGDQRAGEGY